MSLLTCIRKFRRQCSLRLRIRQKRAAIEEANKTCPPESVKSVDEIIADFDKLILERGITTWLDLMEDYFQMRLNIKGRNPDDYVWFCEWMEELDKLYAVTPQDLALLNNKNKFSRFLAEHGLRGTTGLGLLKVAGGKPILVSPEGAEEELRDALHRHGALFCKPQELYKGIGCLKLEDAPEGCLVNGKPMSWEQFIQGSVLAEGQEMQVELLVRQHPAISAFHARAVNTMRLTTMRDEQTGKPVFWYGAMRMGTGDSVVDNVAQGGCTVGLDSSGRLITPAYSPQGYGWKPITHHPGSGLALEGFTVPFFEEAKELVCRAHEPFAERQIFLSWDVAVTPDGPCIIECNSRGDIGFQQLMNGGWRKHFLQYVKPAILKATQAH